MNVSFTESRARYVSLCSRLELLNVDSQKFLISIAELKDKPTLYRKLSAYISGQLSERELASVLSTIAQITEYTYSSDLSLEDLVTGLKHAEILTEILKARLPDLTEGGIVKQTQEVLKQNPNTLKAEDLLIEGFLEVGKSQEEIIQILSS